MTSDRRMISRSILKSTVFYDLSRLNPGGLQQLAVRDVFEFLIYDADDYGRGRAHPDRIRGEAFASAPDAYANVKPEDIELWLKQIADTGAIRLYTIGVDTYYELTGWSKYQDLRYKCKTTVPPPPDSPAISENAEKSAGIPANPAELALEEKIREEKRKEEEEPPAAAKKATLPPEALAGALAFHLQHDGKTPKAPTLERSAKRIRAIHNRNGDPYDCIERVLLWALSDHQEQISERGTWKGWADVLHSIPASPEKWENLKAAYKRADAAPHPDLIQEARDLLKEISQ